VIQTSNDWWMSTKSPTAMFRPDYQTPELATHLRQAAGVDPAIIAADTGVPQPFIKAFQRKLGLRKITGNHRKAKKPKV
jgi:hypothetical protein